MYVMKTMSAARAMNVQKITHVRYSKENTIAAKRCALIKANFSSKHANMKTKKTLINIAALIHAARFRALGIINIMEFAISRAQLRQTTYIVTTPNLSARASACIITDGKPATTKQRQ